MIEMINTTNITFLNDTLNDSLYSATSFKPVTYVITKYTFSPTTTLIAIIGMLVVAMLVAYYAQWLLLRKKFPHVKAYFNFATVQPSVGDQTMWKMIGKNEEIYIKTMSSLAGLLLIFLLSLAEPIVSMVSLPYLLLMYPETKEASWEWLKGRFVKKKEDDELPKHNLKLEVYEDQKADVLTPKITLQKDNIVKQNDLK